MDGLNVHQPDFEAAAVTTALLSRICLAKNTQLLNLKMFIIIITLIYKAETFKMTSTKNRIIGDRNHRKGKNNNTAKPT